MSAAAFTTSFEKLVRANNRVELLQILRVPKNLPRIEDFKDLRTLSTAVPSALSVHKSHIPLLGKNPGEICSGTKLMRYNRTTVGVPCSSTEISAESGFCPHCEQLFLKGFDNDGFLHLDAETMESTFERYEPGKTCVLWHAPPMVHAADLFSSQIQDFKDFMKENSTELPRDWPGGDFKSTASSFLFGAGLLHDDADRANNPYKRTLPELVSIGKYVSEMIGHFLRIRAFISGDA